jgi:hypothetical protein
MASASDKCICATNGHLQCISSEHQCICDSEKKNAHVNCRAISHQCLCNIPTRTLKCRADDHPCVCRVSASSATYKKQVKCRASNHICTCTHKRHVIANKCIANTHECMCSTIINYDAMTHAEMEGLRTRVCKANGQHTCICRHNIPEIANKCVADTHNCMCLFIKTTNPRNDIEMEGLRTRVCKANGPHTCLCTNQLPEIATKCIAHTHECACSIIKTSTPVNGITIEQLLARVCRANGPHPCICRHHRTEIADKCMANTHDCMCSFINKINANTDELHAQALLIRECRSTQNHVCLCAHSMQSVANMCRVHCRRHVLVLIVASRRNPRTPSTPRLPSELWEFLCDEFLM